MNILWVLLVDDHVMLTEALAARLSAAPDLWVVGSRTTDVQQLGEAVSRLRPNVITIEIEQYGLAIGDVLGTLKHACDSTRIVVTKLDVHSRLEAVTVARAAGLGPHAHADGVEPLIPQRDPNTGTGT